MPKIKSEYDKKVDERAKIIKDWIHGPCDPEHDPHRVILGRMLLCIYNRQTQDEKNAQQTKHDNGVGFMHCHAEVGTSIAQQFRSSGRLSSKQWAFVRRMMRKYTRQLAEDYVARNP